MKSFSLFLSVSLSDTSSSSEERERIMAENGNHGVVVDMKDTNSTLKIKEETGRCFSLLFFQKVRLEGSSSVASSLWLSAPVLQRERKKKKSLFSPDRKSVV